MEKISLYNGVEMPIIGFGVFQIPDYNEAKRAVLTALEAGYRLIDTAQAYMNEQAVGDGTDYIDLMLLHQPLGDYIGAWRGIEKLYKEGTLRAIGMANCYPHVLADLCKTFETRPMVNQVEIHPFFQQQLNLDTMKEYGVVPEAWAPFNEGRRNLFTHPVLTEIGKKYGKTAAQVALRWNIQRGVAVIPKSVHEERIRQNIDVFDFALADEDMAKIREMDIGHSEIVNHFDPQWIKMLHSVKF